MSHQYYLESTKMSFHVCCDPYSETIATNCIPPSVPIDEGENYASYVEYFQHDQKLEKLFRVFNTHE